MSNPLLTQGEQLMDFRQRLADMCADAKIFDIVDSWWVLALKVFNETDTQKTGIYESDLTPARWRLKEDMLVNDVAVPQYEVGLHFSTRLKLMHTGEVKQYECLLCVNHDVKVVRLIPLEEVHSWEPLNPPN